MKAYITQSLAILISATALSAHPTGHDHDASGLISHILSEPDHLAILIGCVALAFVGGFYLLRGKSRKAAKSKVDR